MYACVCVFMCMCLYICLSTCVYIYEYVYVYTYMKMCVCIMCVYVWMLHINLNITRHYCVTGYCTSFVRLFYNVFENKIIESGSDRFCKYTSKNHLLAFLLENIRTEIIHPDQNSE